MTRRSLAAVVCAVLLTGTSLTAAAAPSSATHDVAFRAAGVAEDPQVLAISLDGLNPDALAALGHSEAPHLWRLIDQGASTLNARTQYELTVTLPNHTSMVTGRRIDKRKGGHGVTWNDGRPGTVQKAAGHAVASVFSQVDRAGGSAALYASKTKFKLFDRSWPAGVERLMLRDDQDAVVTAAALKDLTSNDRAFTFLHLASADKAGHATAFMSKAYLDAVRTLDALVGTIVEAVDTRPELADLTIVLTADHGGLPGSRQHGDLTKRANYRIPFAVWGAGVEAGDLYDLNPGYRDPGTKRPGLTGKQPVRNGNVANLALDLLGYSRVPGSLFGRTTPLEVSS